jgi:hypothetical protein
MKPVKQYISTSGVANGADLCWINREGGITYRESTRQNKKPNDPSTSAAPWSKFMTPKVETANTFEALSGAGKSGGGNVIVNGPDVKKKKKEETPVLDDWESFET